MPIMATPDPTMATPDKPLSYPRTSLLGLPSELRLLIYAFLPCESPKQYWKHDDHCKSSMSRCSLRSPTYHTDCLYPTDRNEHDRRSRCTCSQLPNWQILSTSTFIRAEALQTFRKATEYRAFLPSERPEHRETGRPLHRLPSSILNDVQSLVLVGSQMHLAVSVFPDEKSRSELRKFCRKLPWMVPNLKQLRIHLEVRDYQYFYSDTFDLRAFGRLATFPHIQCIYIQADDCTKLEIPARPHSPRVRLLLFTLLLGQALERRALAAGKTVKIIDVSRDRRH